MYQILKKKKSKNRDEEFVSPKEVSGSFKHFHYSGIRRSDFGINNQNLKQNNH